MKSAFAIRAKFNRLKIDSHYTRLFEKISNSEKNHITSRFQLINEEKIIICFIPGDQYWWVLTNIRLIINDHDGMNSVMFNRIAEIDLEKIFESPNGKLTTRSLSLKMKDDSVIVLNVEMITWHAVYNILKFAMST